jgi:hypothetical protein
METGTKAVRSSRDECNEKAYIGGGIAAQQASSQFHEPSYRDGFNDGVRKSIDPIDDVFTYHAPNAEQLVKYQALREAAKHFARIIQQNTPYCADQIAALRKVREAVMTANAAIRIGRARTVTKFAEADCFPDEG